MSDEARMAPVQGSDPIPWAVHVAAWEVYAKRYGEDQSASRLAQRGGFSVGELDKFLPGWRSDAGRAIFSQQELTAALAAERERCATWHDKRAEDAETEVAETEGDYWAEQDNIEARIKAREHREYAAAIRALGDEK